MWRYLNRMKVLALMVVGGLPFFAAETQAMPSFARQTGMVCNSCHIGTDNVPNFTRTGRLFAMRGYVRPVVREQLRTEGMTAEGVPQYGGDYISLNWTDFFSGRFVTELVQGGKANNGVKNDTTSKFTARFAMFYTGPITDWMGLWTEIAYLGNNDLDSVTTGNTGETGLNLFAFDEFRLSTSRTFGANSFMGMSLGNEPGDVVTQFVFPLVTPQFFSNGQGGSGSFKQISVVSLHAFLDDRLWLQFAPQSGMTNNSWSNGWIQYYAVAYNFFRQTENDLWLHGEYSRGNDNVSILTPLKSSFICPGTCPAGVTDSTLSFTNTYGAASVVGAPVETVDKFWAYRIGLEHAVADRGPHSWIAKVTAVGTKQDYVSGASAERGVVGAYLRYFYQRTYGFQALVNHDWKYEYKTPAGQTRDIHSLPVRWNFVGLWNPAMNVSFHLNYTPKTSNYVFDDQRSTLYQDQGYSYNLGMEYSF